MVYTSIVHHTLHPSLTCHPLVLGEPSPANPSESRNITLAHHANTLGVVAGALARLLVGTLAVGLVAVASQAALDSEEFALVRRSANHILGRFLGPALDEVAVAAECRAARQLAGEGTGPAVGQRLAQVVADREAELRHRLEALRAPVVGAVAARLVGSFERRLVDALGEVQQLLEMGGASLAGEAVLVQGDRVVALAEPGCLCVGNHGALRGGGRVTSDHLQVLRDGNLGGGLAKVVVRAEAHDGDGLVVGAILGVEGRGDPVGREIIGVLSVGAASLELGGGFGVGSKSIGAEEGVQVGLVVRAREHDWVDVLVHVRRRHAHDGVGAGELGEQAGAQEESVGRRHPVFLLYQTKVVY